MTVSQHPAALPDRIASVEELDELLSRPSEQLIASLARGSGDLLVLGAGGKMGPTLTRMARRAFDAAGRSGDVVAVSRWSDERARWVLDGAGVRTQRADLLDAGSVKALPDAPQVVFMAGRKFGSTGAEHLTWAMNVFMPGLIAERYRDANLVVFSTGNVYPFTLAARGGAREDDPVGPVGEYAQSCLGRERVFQHFSALHGTRVAIARLSYAVELRYGVLLDIAQSVWSGAPVDLRTGFANVIWQGDACDLILRLLEHTASPPTVLNVTNPETLSIRRLAEQFGELLDRAPRFDGEESETALLINAARAAEVLGAPAMPIETVMGWVAEWVRSGGPVLGKPTGFEIRDGRF
jgi:nucleoside-diphosphate-sugar epimerase